MSDAYAAHARRSKPRLAALRGRAEGETVYVIGTGPSILDTDLGRLAGSDVIYLNNALSLHERIAPRSALVVVTDHLRAIELRPAVVAAGLDCAACTGLIFNVNVDPALFREPFLFAMPRLAWRTDRSGVPRPEVSYAHGFSDDVAAGLYMGRSVLFPAIQLAAWFGAREISLVGVDMTNADGAYFDATIRGNWGGFDYEKDGRPHLLAMADHLAARGVRLRNATVGGRLDALPHDPELLRAAGGAP